MATREVSRERTRGDRTSGLSRLWILVILLAVVVMATTASVQSGALGHLAAWPLLAVTVALFFAMSFAAMRMDTPIPGAVPFHGGARVEDAPAGDREAEPPEIDEVYAWRSMRLRRLGVPRELTANLAAEPAFSVHELERLLAAGCPLDTALRILDPD
jgi:uncharacterized integral membrane protein